MRRRCSLGRTASAIQRSAHVGHRKGEQAKRGGGLHSFVELVSKGAPSSEPGLHIENLKSAAFDQGPHRLRRVALPYVTAVYPPSVLVGHRMHGSGPGEPPVARNVHEKVPTGREGTGQFVDCPFVIDYVLQHVECGDQVE